MQLYVINWSFQNAEDQLFATKEFCEFVKENKLSQYIEGFELIFIAHIPQDGSGLLICKAQNNTTLFNILNMCCLLYTSDAADERSSVDLGGRRIIKKNIQLKIQI